MNKVISFLLVTLCLSCATGTSRLIEKEKLNFSYTDDSYLFFRNMRQAQYDRTIMEREGLRLYQYTDFSEEQFFKTLIVVNWRMNKAYMLIDLKDSTAKSTIKIYAKKPTGQFKEIAQKNTRRQGELAFLTDIYNHLITEDSLFIVSEEDRRKPLFQTMDDQEAFRVAMYDFYRLTGVL